MKNYIYITIITFTILLITFYLYFNLNNDFAFENIREFSKISKSVPKEQKTMMYYFQHNISIVIVSLILCLIPILGFGVYLFNVSTISFAIALMFFDMIYFNKNIISTLLTQVAPHGIFEIPAIFITDSLCLFLSVNIVKLILRKNNKSFKQILKFTFKIFVLTFPLFVIASIVESFL